MAGLLALLVTLGAIACDPYACTTDYRSATYVGRLGDAVAPSGNLGDRDSGQVFLELNEWRGSASQQSVLASANVWGFVSGVSEIHVHEGAPGNTLRLLWKSANGYLVRDSIWSTGIDPFGGPAAWADVCNALNEGRGYVEVHSPTGDSVSAGLRQTSISPFSPSCA